MLNQQQHSLNAVPFPPNQWNRSHRINEKIGHIRSEVTGCQYRAYPNRLLHNTNSNRFVQSSVYYKMLKLILIFTIITYFHT